MALPERSRHSSLLSRSTRAGAAAGRYLEKCPSPMSLAPIMHVLRGPCSMYPACILDVPQSPGGGLGLSREEGPRSMMRKTYGSLPKSYDARRRARVRCALSMESSTLQVDSDLLRGVSTAEELGLAAGKVYDRSLGAAPRFRQAL